VATEKYPNLFVSPKCGCTLSKNILIPLLTKYEIKIPQKTLIARNPIDRLTSYFTGGLIRVFHDNERNLGKLGIYVDANNNPDIDMLRKSFDQTEMKRFHVKYDNDVRQFNANYIIGNTPRLKTCQLTFEDILNGLLTTGADNCEWHLKTQTLGLGDTTNIKIFTITQIKEDPIEFCKYLGIPLEEYEAGFKNAASTNQTSYSDMGDIYLGDIQILRLVENKINPRKQNLINKTNEKIVKEIYKEDFELLEKYI
jgi:hypothetical protein